MRLDYSHLMRLLSLLLLSTLSTLVVAGAYKWTGPDGLVTYSDRPVSGAEMVSVEVDPAIAAPEADVEDGNPGPGPYSSFELANPEANATLRDPEGKVRISLIVDPPLASDHHLQILLDGEPVPGDVEGTQILLQGLDYGSHQVQARVLDELDAAIAQTTLVSFHLRKPLPESALP